MANKKLTKDEIKIALKHCANIHCVCSDCILFEPEDDECQCCKDLKLNALDLINQYEEEIRNLKYDYDNLQRQFNEIYQQFHYLSNVEIPYLYSFTEDKDKKLETLANILLGVKAEAVKEFAERVKIRFSGTLQVSGWLIQKVVEDILQEMGVE